MMRIKYVLENQNDVLEPSEDTLMYLPIKIGEFSVDHVDNSMHFQKSYTMAPDGISLNKKEGTTNNEKPLDFNMDLVDNEKAITLTGMKRQDSKPTEALEEEIRFLHQRIDSLERDIQFMMRSQQASSRFEDDNFELTDNDSSSYLNDSLPLRTKSGRFTNVTDIAYLYSVPLVREENSKILSMGLPIDHNAEIDDIIEGLETTNKMVNFRIETATIDSLQDLFMIKPKIVHLSCHGDFDNKANTYYLAFESKKKLGMMEKLTMSRLKKLFENQKNLKSIECMLVSACHSQKIGELMLESGVPIVICINAPFKVQDEAARSFGKYFHSALVRGMSYQEAFTATQNFVAAHKESYSIYS